eukprot:9293344-Heterocapsa_arctica.AAC.1
MIYLCHLQEIIPRYGSIDDDINIDQTCTMNSILEDLELHNDDIKDGIDCLGCLELQFVFTRIISAQSIGDRASVHPKAGPPLGIGRDGLVDGKYEIPKTRWRAGSACAKSRGGADEREEFRAHAAHRTAER